MLEHNQYISKLRMLLARTPLPGTSEQDRMSVAGRREVQFKHEISPREAAVLVILYPRNDQTYLVLIKRKVHPKDRHSGQISLPGGKREDGEELFETALRESQEEIDAPIDALTLLGPLTPLYIPVSNFKVYPFIASSAAEIRFVPEESEVDSVLEIPLKLLFDDDIRRTTDISLYNGLRLRNVPYFDVHDQVIWGATAMILSEFIRLAKAAEQTHERG